MADWVSNGPISTPILLPDIEPDTDFNGVKFNYNIGVFFVPSDEMVLPLTLPPLWELP